VPTGWVSDQVLMVAVLGLDGAGKSTLIKTVRPEIERLLHTETEHRHWRPGFLPRLSKLAGQEEQRLGPVRNPHDQPPSRPFAVHLANHVLYA